MKRSISPWLELIAEILLIFGGVFGISLFYQTPILSTALLIIASVVVIKFWHKPNDIYIYVAAAIIGPIAESISVYFGVWQYATSNAFGIPLWLPFAWGLSVLLLIRLAETIVAISKK